MSRQHYGHLLSSSRLEFQLRVRITGWENRKASVANGSAAMFNGHSPAQKATSLVKNFKLTINFGLPL